MKSPAGSDREEGYFLILQDTFVNKVAVNYLFLVRFTAWHLSSRVSVVMKISLTVKPSFIICPCCRFLCIEKKKCKYPAINVQINQLDDCNICHIVYLIIVYFSNKFNSIQLYFKLAHKEFIFYKIKPKNTNLGSFFNRQLQHRLLPDLLWTQHHVFT